MAFGFDPIPLQDGGDRHTNNSEVEQQTPVLHVVDVKSKLLGPAQPISAAGLSKTGNARPNVVPSCLFRRVKGQVLNKKGSRSNQAHVAREDVNERRKFVKAR